MEQEHKLPNGNGKKTKPSKWYQFKKRYRKFQLSLSPQQKLKGSSGYDFWFSSVIIGQFAINKIWKTAVRVEYYQDETGIIIPTETQ